MSRIDDLIHELCPGGVDWQTLGQLGTFVRGNGLQKKDFTDTGIGCIHYGEIHTHYGIATRATKSFVSPELARRLKLAQTGNLVIATTSENDEDVCKSVAWLGADDIAISGDSYIYRHSLDPTYVAYLFRSLVFQHQKSRRITGTKVRRVSRDALASIRVPVPPLEVQRAIVEILDTFTALEAELEEELEAELEARRKQYAHYRDQLLSFSDSLDVSWLPMGQIGTFTRGRRFTKKDMSPAGIPSIHYGEIYTHYAVSATTTLSHVRDDLGPSLRYANPGDVVIAGVGETVEDVGKAVAWLGDQRVAFHDDCFAYRSDQDPTYIAYVMRTARFNEQKDMFVARAKVKRLSGESMAKIQIPIPRVEEQRRIVAILDQFDALVNDLSIGLPAELAARRKQYEYYRDKLLTFPEAA